eukprot:TRINITY_DN33635_c0_g1_i1.p1 TRINITY_DN33635_c0_g1~~TRINITY_DN33635_c0_g1_i1.p1  ORF type:complete len:268 (+),score=41.40 TRINITY_DN33635_c0_g1_i1:25-828(+)
MWLEQPSCPQDFDIRMLSSPGPDMLFPSRAVSLPDELRGALLLPLEDEDLSSTSQSLERLSAMVESVSLAENSGIETRKSHRFPGSYGKSEGEGLETSSREPSLRPAGQASRSCSPALEPSLRPASWVNQTFSPFAGLPADLVGVGDAQLNDSFFLRVEEQDRQLRPNSSRSNNWSLSDADLQDLLAQAEEHGLVDLAEESQSPLSDRCPSVPRDLWETDSIVSVGGRCSSLSELGWDRRPEKETCQSPFLRTESPASLAQSLGICM